MLYYITITRYADNTYRIESDMVRLHHDTNFLKSGNHVKKLIEQKKDSHRSANNRTNSIS